MYVVRSVCRSCGSADLEIVLSLGEMPLPDALLLPSQLEEPERRFPLDVALCEECSLLQLIQTVSPSEIYDDRYRYLSSASVGYVAHAFALAERLIQERGLDGNSDVIEIGSNDGTLLRRFQSRGVRTLGIDPAPGPVSEAHRAGIATLPTFFTHDLASQLAAEGRRADVLLACNVLSQVPDLHGFLAGVRMILGDGAIAVFEVPYVRDLVERGEFDTIDHAHLCYFSVTSLIALLDSANLTINHVEHFPVHGGVLRFYVSRSLRCQPSVEAFLDAEAAAGVHDAMHYAGLGLRAATIRARLRSLLDGIKASRKSIVGYGAAGRGSTMLNYCNVGDAYLDYVVDLNTQKQGCFLPGVHLPVLSPDRLISNRPDYVLLLAANARDEVLQQHEAYLQQGGRFIVPIPEPAII